MRTLTILAHATLCPAGNPGWELVIPAAQKRRMPRIWQMAYACVYGLLGRAAARPASIVVGTALGALDETRQFLDGVFTTNQGSPRSFIASVHNSMAGKLAQDFTITGPNLTLCDGHNSFASAVVSAALLADADFPALVVAIDEHIPLLDTVIPGLSGECREYFRNAGEEGVAAFLCDLSGQAGKPAIRAAGPVPCAAGEHDEQCRRTAADALGSDQDLVPVRICSASFIRPAFLAAQLIDENRTGRHVLCCGSPASGAVSVVEVSV